MKIPFNKPYFAGNEIQYLQDAVNSGKISGNGNFTKKCHQYFQEKYGFKKCLLTTSCTDALEMAAILLDLKEGDEVIVFGQNPSVEALAACCHTIPYEIFTNISERVKRVYFQE